jgi:beta-phosphoglucomutase
MDATIAAYKAFLFDLNGTMINDMPYHLKAWDEIINKNLKTGLSRTELQSQLYGKNEELLVRIFGKDRFNALEINRLSVKKEQRYQQLYKPHLQLIDGLESVLEDCIAANIKMAIGSAAIRLNIDFVIDNLNIRHYFGAIVSADDVRVSKPDPGSFLLCAERLGILPEDCLVFEDAPKGVEAAQNAGMDCVVLTTMHGASAFRKYDNIIRFVSDYNEL